MTKKIDKLWWLWLFLVLGLIAFIKGWPPAQAVTLKDLPICLQTGRCEL